MFDIIKAGIILLLPSIIMAEMRVEIRPGDDSRNPEVVVSGNDRAKATNNDMELFKLAEDPIRESLERVGWVRVNEININHASAYGYKDLYVNLRPKSARILRANDKIVKFNKKTIRNDGERPKTVHNELEENVIETMTTKWHDLIDISVGHDINHVMGFNRIVHSSSYGQDDTASRQLTISAEIPDDIVLQPGQYVKAGLEVKETTLEVRIDYEVSLDGDIYFGHLCARQVIKYCLKHRNLDINEYFRYLDQRPVIKSYEIVTFTYYHDAKVSVGEIMCGNDMFGPVTQSTQGNRHVLYVAPANGR